MEEWILKTNFYEKAMVVCIALAIILAVIAVVLWIMFDVREAVSYVGAHRSRKMMRREKKHRPERKKPGRRGKTADGRKLRDSGKSGYGAGRGRKGEGSGLQDVASIGSGWSGENLWAADGRRGEQNETFQSRERCFAESLPPEPAPYFRLERKILLAYYPEEKDEGMFR